VKTIEPIFGEKIYTKKLKSPKQIIELGTVTGVQISEMISKLIGVKQGSPILKEKK
jgi:hypothetical protein